MAPLGRSPLHVRLLGLAALATLLGACVLGLLARMTPADAIVYTVWGDRDLGRAAAVPREFPTSGAEFTRGSRTPGGFFYVYLWLQTLISRDPLMLHRVMVAANVLALVLLAALAWRLGGRWAGLTAAALFAAAPSQLDFLRFVGYNPSYPILFAVLGYWFFGDILLRGRPGRLPPLVAAVCAAGQIHLSFLLLLPTFLAALRAHGRRFSPWARLSALGVAAVLYGPFLVAETRAGWPFLREVRDYQGLGVNSPWLYSITTSMRGEIALGLRNLGYTLFGTATGQNPSGLIELSLTFVTVAGFLSTSLWALRRRPAEAAEAGDLRPLVRRFLLVVLLGVLSMSLFGSTFGPRFSQFMTPAAILVTALGAARFAAWVEKRKDAVSGAAAVVIVAWAAGAFYVNTAGWVRLRSRPAVTLPEWRDLLAHLHRELGFAAADVPLRTAVLLQGVEGWTPLSVETAGISFLAESYLPGASGPRKADCALVLIAPAGTVRPESWAELPAAIGHLALLDQVRADLSPARTVIAYRLPWGNCLANVGNRYALTAEEKLLAALRVPEAVGTFARAVGPVARGTRYQVRVQGRDQEGRVKRRRPLDLLIDLETTGGMVQAAVHSNDLRGYDGISSYHLTRPRLVMRTGTNATHAIPIAQGVVGGWFNPIRAPWRSAPVAVPMGGPYRLELAWDDAQFQEYGGHEGQGSVVVSEDVFVR